MLTVVNLVFQKSSVTIAKRSTSLKNFNYSETCHFTVTNTLHLSRLKSCDEPKEDRLKKKLKKLRKRKQMLDLSEEPTYCLAKVATSRGEMRKDEKNRNGVN